MVKRNPKQEGSNLWDCKTQIGLCPCNCNQCFANRPGAAYIPMDEQILPSIEEVGDGIVRANCLHDSNFGKKELVEYCSKYSKVFYNTSIPKFDFPAPVVFTANAEEEQPALLPSYRDWNFDNLMFVRLRVSPTNLHFIKSAVESWTQYCVPVVLTFMAYYEEDKIPKKEIITDVEARKSVNIIKCYTHKVRHINSYWCPTKEFMVYVLKRMKAVGGRLVTMCSSFDSYYCRDCRNCETYYYQTIKHMGEV